MDYRDRPMFGDLTPEQWEELLAQEGAWWTPSGVKPKCEFCPEPIDQSEAYIQLPKIEAPYHTHAHIACWAEQEDKDDSGELR